MANNTFASFKEYREDTLKRIIEEDSRFSKLSNEQLAYLYRQWSEQTFSAGWMSCSDYSIKRFVQWATTSPFQQALEAENA